MNFYRIDDLLGIKKLQDKEKGMQYKQRWCDAIEVERKNGDCEYCPVCGRPVSLLKWLPPRKVKLSNASFPDRLSTWLSEPMVISERVKEAFLTEGIRGIGDYADIEVTRVGGKDAMRIPPPKYYCAEIAFSSTVFLDPEKTIFLGQPCDWRCPCCNPLGRTREKTISVSLNAKSWDGSDVFIVYGLGLVVSQKIFDLVEKHQFTNFNLYPIDNLVL